jgi:ADP-ribose pyrophosphatase YjhB (NUDIX family)
VQLRIGHGLYGVDPATHDRLRATGTIVEFNLNSNFALNNIQDATAVPIREYVRHGIPVVLGTDGYGIYQSTCAFEARAAALCGLEEADFAHIRATESRYIDKQSEIAATLPEAAAFEVPEAAPFRHYTPQVMARKAAEISRRDLALRNRLKEIQVLLLDSQELATLMRGRRCISFAGAWKASWNAISPRNQQLIREELEKLLRDLPPEQTLLITGGTDLGVEGVVQNLAMPMGFKILGAIVAATPIDSLMPGAVTHAHLVGRSLYDKAAGLYRLMKSCNGLCLFIGGGSIVNDEIQTAGNLRLRYLLMDGPEGASTLQARQQPERAFRCAADVLKVLNENAPAAASQPFWHLGPNPTVDMLVTRHDPVTARRQVLLIQRDVDAPTEGGKWALPGGFQTTDAPRGTPWRPGPESPRAAAVRELFEESGLDLHDRADQLIPIGIYEGANRDPRDTPMAWSRSEVFAVHVTDDRAAAPLCGATDACDARWFDVSDLPVNLAFDHARILADGLHARGSA